jgi:CheY-like chemotaxis protein
MPKKILLADDSITIQKVVELTFSDGDYEVTAVNNGAKAVQKLSEMRPDIILSDIIMPEKNGYEVCEFVKSHPEYRNIPVVLLTGTFEPFDPDRAEKAGCDAVVTKPFESQSLIHKVEELIAAARSASASAPAAAPAEAPAASSPWEEETPAAAPSPFSGEASFSPAPAPEPFTHDNDIFGAAPTPMGATTEMPFAEPPSFFDAPTPPPAPEPEPSPWDEQPAAAFSGETRAFPKMSFDDMQRMAGETSAPVEEPPVAEAAPLSFETEPEPEPEFQPEPVAAFGEDTMPPFDEPPAEEPPAAQEPEPEPMWATAATAPPESPQIPISARDLTDDQVDRIARRVVELMSDQIVRNIAWEVIPDLAETCVKERIRQLESEA